MKKKPFDSNNEIDLIELIEIFWNEKIKIVLITIILVVITYGYNQLPPKSKPQEQLYKNLLTIKTLPEIHDYTDEWCNQQRKKFKEEILDIATKEGIISEQNIKEVKVEKSFTEILETVFSTEHDYNSEKIKEQLFKAKLYAFEMPHIKNSDSRDLKAQLRKSETIKDVFKIISQF